MLFYSLFLFIAIIVPFKVDSFNYVFLSFFSLTGLMLLPSSKSILFCLLFGILFLGVLLYTQTGFLYFTNDFLLICLISLVLYSPLKYTFTNIEIKIFTSVLIVYLLLLLFTTDTEMQRMFFFLYGIFLQYTRSATTVS